MARFLAGQGATVEVCCAGAPGAPATEQEGAITVHRLAYAWPRGRERLFYQGGAPEALDRAPLRWLQAPPFVLRLLGAAARRVARWDALVSHWLLPAGLCGLGIAGGRPHLAVAHSADVHLLGRLGPAAGPLARAFGRPATHLRFTTRALRAEFAGLAPAAAAGAVVAPMGIAAATLRFDGGRARARAELGLEGDAFVVLCLGRLVPVKGVDVLLAATRGLAGVTLLVAGEGPERPRLQAAAGPGIRFLGAVAGDARARALAAADLLCLPSRVQPDGLTEGAPTEILEAQAVGLPVVASRVGGVADLVRAEEDGLLVPPDDPDALRTTLGRLRADAALRERLTAGARAVGPTRDWAVAGPRLCAPLLAGARG
ncbi:MAG: glycosyltransferase family 4 protein [Deltaproteobacteria bacterium]|nr:glycosyltransferase family 4 protein [Deltaproteobacteria bacterium]